MTWLLVSIYLFWLGGVGLFALARNQQANLPQLSIHHRVEMGEERAHSRQENG